MSDAANIPRHEHAFVPGVFSASDTKSRGFKRALNAWAQGDVLKGIGIFWATPYDVDILTGISPAEGSDGAYPVYRWDGSPADEDITVDAVDWSNALSIVTSQTCDIAPAGPGARHHTVQVSPLERYDHRDESTKKSIERGEYVDLIAVPGVPAPGEWAANLRISLPVSKAILAANEPIRGFPDKADALAFSERVAAKYRRPALHDALSGPMTNSLCELVRSARDGGADWPEEIEQFRLEVLEGTRLSPVKVRIMVVELNRLGCANRQDLRSWRVRQNKVLGRGYDISLAPMRYVALKDVSVADYRSAVQLRVPELGQSLRYY